MIRNYLKIAWRNLLRNKGFSITNLLGLAIGMTCTMLIFLWVRDELNFDRFHKNYDNIYQVIAHRDFKNQVFTDRNMVLPMAQELEKRFPEVKHAVVTTYRQPLVLEYKESRLKKFNLTVSEHFFEVFTWKFLKGDARSALKDPSSIVLTRSSAMAFFGNEDPIGKVLRIDNNRNATVTAVVEDPPFNSTFVYDCVQPFNYSDDYVKNAMQNWTNSSWNVFLHMRDGANMQLMDRNINAVKKEHDRNDAVSTYFTFPMSKWRLYSDFKDGKNVGGMIEYVRLFIIIAFGILLIACVNFMNLSTARSEKRSKEVGIRKTLGSDRKQLVMQFFCESLILALIAFVISLLAVYALMPAFNKLVDKHLTIFIQSPGFWLSAFATVLFTGFVAGSYPALYLSSFNPIKVLKGTFTVGKEAILPRRILVVTQFVISILLISGTIIIYQQIQHVKGRDIGYNPDNLLMVPATEDINKNFAVIKQELLNSGQVASVTRTSAPITEIWWKSPSPDYEGKPANTSIIFSGIACDVDFTKTMGIKVIDGREFAGVPADSAHMMLNKAAVDAMNIKNPVGMKMRYGRELTVIGIIDNVVQESPFKPVDPLMIFFDPNFSNTISVRLKDNVNPRSVLPAMEKVFAKHNPAFPFDYQFADEEFGKKFIAEELINRITNLFAALAIFICCIGLAGLASFTIEKRTREIGIRKVLGASINQLLALISKEFLKLVMIAFVIAVPLTWWLMNNWLGNYVYHVEISIWLFAAVGAVVLLLTLAVVSANTISAARNNPVKSLRTE
jgi:putative ABC transport system permease protein